MIGSGALQARYGQRVGERIGSLTFAALASQRGDNNRLLGIFRCDCGAQPTLQVGRVLNGRKRLHCGCQTDKGKSRTHGMRNSPEYASWSAMKVRCLDPDNKDYPRWGGRGVTICQAWIDSFVAFYEHIGPRPAGTTLDRINNERGYEPGNVRWATASEQQRNRRTSCRWHIKGLWFDACSDAASHFGVSEHTVWRWAHGQFDKRRNTYTPKREDCHAVARY